uniref:CSON005081 protein n=1 Tax=Culicoides sonorensis TaxID=179676 RepID=A0A336LUS1_CULSO
MNYLLNCTLLTLLITLFHSTLAQVVEKDVDILILGAGAAGIGAARTLQFTNLDLDILVLEGSEKVGGRVRNAFMKNVDPNDTLILTSAGAQWLHGKGNPVYDYALEHGMVFDDGADEGMGLYIRDDQTIMDPDFVDEINGIVEEITDECEKFWNDTSNNYPPSFDAFLREEFEKRIASFANNDKELARQILDWNRRFLAVDNALQDPEVMSAKHWGRQILAGGQWEHLSFRNGYAEVIESMASELKPGTILLQKWVSNVDWNPFMNKILVRCNDMTYYTAKHVIVTFSLGVLKRNHLQIFNPSLPATHQLAIDCLGYGTVSKIVLQFYDNWWNDEEGLQFVYSSFNYTNAPWTRYLVGFDKFTTGDKTFIGWIGQQGVQEMDKLSDAEIIDDTLALIEQFTGRKPSYPRRYYISRWDKYPFSYGSYSYPSVNCDPLGITPQDLGKPITTNDQITHYEMPLRADEDPKPLILFAGEGVSQYYWSTAHGAYMNGEEQATVLLNYYARNSL